MLLRKSGTAASILAVALLVAILASTNSVYNHVSSQVQALGRLVGPGRTYLVLSAGSSTIAESRVGLELAGVLRGLSYVESVLPQRVFTANLASSHGSRAVRVRGVEDVGGFLKARGAHLSGAAAENAAEANAGEVLAGVLSVSVGDELSLEVGGKEVRVKVVGVFRTRTQSDAELLVPMGTANALLGDEGTVSFIEFSLKGGVEGGEAVSQVTRLLGGGVKVVQVQQLKEFLQRTNAQTLAFLNAWSLIVYAVVAAASYVIATRAVAESSYELAMLRAVGASRGRIFALILAYVAAIAFLGSILGIALGVVGAQAASTALRWAGRGVEVSPFMELQQAFSTLLLALASSILGCLYPAFKAARVKYVERAL